MNTRRKFLKRSGVLAIGAGLSPILACTQESASNQENVTVVKEKKGIEGPVILSTWNHGIAANTEAWKILSQGGNAVDAAEMGVAIVEADPTGRSVGIGGTPDRDGIVTLDACIMDHNGNAGSVCFLQDILHPISVARKVMDDTPHVMLAGEGAKRFALDMGFEKVDLLVEETKKDWKEWLESSDYQPVINVENHDTIGLICKDANGNLSGACTTSGLGYKMHGRVGDSPIIGAGLFVDNEVGAATATGLGEVVMKTCGSFLIVELMRQGYSPQEACEEAVKRIAEKNDVSDLQVGYLAMNKAGEVGSYAIHPGFNYALKHEKHDDMVDSQSLK